MISQMENLIKKWKFDHTVYQDDHKMGTFSHTLSLFKEPETEDSRPFTIFTVIWEIPALMETIKAQISTLDMVIHDYRDLFEIDSDVLAFLYDFGFCLDSTIDPNWIFINQNYDYDEYA
jgi:hypothetical protein